jgi:site-specific recombinase XerD
MEDYRHQIAEFGKYLRDSGKLAATVESYSRDASGFTQYLESYGTRVSQVAPETLISYRDHLSHGKGESVNSVRRAIIGIRQFYRYLVAARVISDSPFDQVPLPGREEELPSQLNYVDVDQLVLACKQRSPAYRALRDAAIVCLLAYEGVKATELIALNWSDAILNSESGSLRIRGSRERSIILSSESTATLLSYQSSLCAADQVSLAPDSTKAIFLSFKGKESGTVVPRITRHGLKFVLYEIGQSAGLPHLNTELLRHYAMEFLIARGMGTSELMQHLGLRTVGNIAKHLVAAQK